MSSTVTRALEELRHALSARFGGRLREVVLFGSHARGEAHEESDVDVLVVVDDLTESERSVVFGLAYDVDAAQPEWLGLSPLAYSTEQVAELHRREKLLFRDIAREGIRL